ncbi:universal stress protein [Beggiatoa leptomitoformis]|uniref:Universal stress protein n=1 Tax=Beggiatoa leptomitoformis TaxID=288004 RepID=A0A2N9YHP4_9GAMM|nr:universal stress protein [Beggiatoa leptomitoformis]ALG67754.1 universal stress protein [Beggiatoa leptomitoformis]AUI70004.1 universal stress protein [Beggiatoa leptomitoformis]
MLPTIKKILYATDMGENADVVFRYAISLAHRYDARLTLVHVTEQLGTFGEALFEAHFPEDKAKQMHTEAVQKVQKGMQQQLEVFCATELKNSEIASHLVESITVIEGHNPAQAIVEHAKAQHIDMIVMGTRGHNALGELFIGSVARRVTQLSAIPVLIVPIIQAEK